MKKEVRRKKSVVEEMDLLKRENWKIGKLGEACLKDLEFQGKEFCQDFTR